MAGQVITVDWPFPGVSGKRFTATQWRDAPDEGNPYGPEMRMGSGEPSRNVGHVAVTCSLL